ncbi:MAG: protein translocase subunit SecF [Chloroflexi bacterium]|nr:protein translocase subunit SecF [Chloroflexota bacterium]
MFNLIQKRRWYFLISAVLLGLGIVAMIYSLATLGSPVRLGIDFTSGSLLELRFEGPVDADEVREMVTNAGFADATVQRVGEGNQVVIRTKTMDVDTKEALKVELAGRFGSATELRYENVGPTIGRETTRAAVLAIIAASVAILFFIAIAFRKVPNAFRYGVCAITKMFHDVIFLLGVASLLGLLAGWEVDALFLTAVVTVVGFSVQDVIVVFDRIRENIRRRRGEPYETIVNRSLLETLHRSLATQLNAIFVMIAIIFFGGATIRQFMAVMLIGMVTGTYSSLFFAVPMLVAWERGEIGRLFRRA